MELSRQIEKVTRYGYRTATVTQRVFQVDYDSGDSWDTLQQELAERAKEKPDNHECYAVENEDGGVLYFHFSDWKVYVGLGLRVESW